MLCPVCGLPSESTGIVCPKHISVSYKYDVYSGWQIFDYVDRERKEPQWEIKKGED